MASSIPFVSKIRTSGILSSSPHSGPRAPTKCVYRLSQASCSLRVTRFV
jgi:hypothetical protein